jgi:F0F1-type ATP synthase assembly protein I
MLEKQKKEKKQHSSYIYLSSISIQMVLIILGGYYLGAYLDRLVNGQIKLFTGILSLLSVVAALFFVYKRIKK